MIRVLTASETQAFLAANPIDASTLPAWGQRVTWHGLDYMAGLNHNTGQLYVMDVTAIDPESGDRIDPSIADQSEIEQIWRAVIAGVGDSAKQVLDWTPLVFLAGAILLGVFIWGERKHGPEH